MSRGLLVVQADLVPRHPTFALSPTGTCVARSTRVEEDGSPADPPSDALAGHCHDRNRSFDVSPCLAALVWP